MSWRGIRGWTRERVEWRIKHGYGQGEMASYIPWVKVRDVPSRGTSARMYSSKTGRTMHFLSDIEQNTFLMAEFREDFVDYWEQWPLERRDSLWAAERLGVRHPIYPGGKEPVVMTADAVFTRRTPTGLERRALDCKHSDSLKEARTQEKLAITKLALQRIALPHILVTEQSIGQRAIRNIKWVRIAVRKRGEIEPFAGAFEIWPMRLHKRLLADQADQRRDAYTVAEYCQAFDIEHSLPTGWALRCMKLLMWQHLVKFDLNTLSPATTLVSQLELRPCANHCVVSPGISGTPQVSNLHGRADD